VEPPDIIEGIPMPSVGMQLTVVRIVQHPVTRVIYFICSYPDGPGMPAMRIVVRYEYWLFAPGFLLPPILD
jgi:hypothetical protein